MITSQKVAYTPLAASDIEVKHKWCKGDSDPEIFVENSYLVGKV